MNKNALRSDLLLLVTSCVWGFGFVAQRSGMNHVGPFTFNAVRFLLGSASLFPLILFRKQTGAMKRAPLKPTLRASCLAGSCLFCAVSLQQIGILFTTAGNCGFITGLYMVLTPLFGMALGKKTGLPTWIGAAFSLCGLFFLSSAGSLGRINRGDIITAISAVFWAFHVLLIDALVQKTDPIALASGQFAFCGLCSAAVVLFRETVDPASLLDALVPILYGALGSVGVGYTLQVIAQKRAPPAHAAIILCLEGVFAALGGVLLLAEPLGKWTLLGFGLMLCGMLATQWDVFAPARPKGAA
jgi:drug/metabolite transporter (DMT)-like permease